MSKLCPICWETVILEETAWPYSCGHSICKNCHERSFINGSFACPECRSPPLCPYALFLQNRTGSDQIPPGAMSRLYNIASNLSTPPDIPPNVPGVYAPMSLSDHPLADDSINMDHEWSTLASRSLIIINNQFLDRQNLQLQPPQEHQTRTTENNIENAEPDMAAIATRALEMINTQLNVQGENR